jgi:2-methylcitrate dehydratase PrpD
MTATARIARFVRALDMTMVPPEVAEKTRTCLLNGYGIALGCRGTPYAVVARSAALNMYGEHPAGATLLGDGRRTAIAGAVLANSALFHGRAQEDTCGAAHLGTILIPLLTGLIETKGFSVARLLPALLAGYETGGLLEKAYAGSTTPGAFRASPVYGTLAAAAAVAKMMDLPEDRIAAALANAASFCGGILQSFTDGTDEWRYQVGVAAQVGLVAAELACAGSVSAPHAIEGKAGFVRAFARQDCDVEALLSGLGSDWAVMRVTFKPFPVCAFNQTPVTAALAMREKLGGAGIAAVRVHMNPYETGYAGMDATGPFDSVSGTLMSIPFCIATTLLHGVPDMARMTTYGDREVNALIPRIQLVSDAGVPQLCCRIELTTSDGRALVQDQRMTTRDFAFDRKGVSALVRRIGAEQAIPVQAYDVIESFVDGLPGGGVHEVLRAFAMLTAARRGAKAA